MQCRVVFCLWSCSCGVVYSSGSWSCSCSCCPALSWTSKTGPNVVCFCLAPQRRALFQHLNFKKCSGTASCLHFWLRHVLRATAARARYFSTSQLPTVLRNWGFLTWKCASRHNGVQFFIRFSQSIFSTLQSHKTLEKHSVLLYFSTFSRTYIFLLLTLSLLWPSFFFSSLLWLAKSAFPSVHMESILSEVWLLNFLRLCFFVYK